MLDTLTLADRLTEAGVEQKQANAIAHAIHDAQGEIVTKADLQQVRTDLQHFATKADLYRVISLQTGVILATLFAILRFLD
jgi:2-phosphoglycerate kinase